MHETRNWSVLLDEPNIHLPARLAVKNLAAIFQDSYFIRCSLEPIYMMPLTRIPIQIKTLVQPGLQSGLGSEKPCKRLEQFVSGLSAANGSYRRIGLSGTHYLVHTAY